LELIEPDAAYIRTEEYDVFRNAAFRAFLSAQDFEVVGMRPFRDALRAAPDQRQA
jgi:hypothetical protein